MHRIVQLCVCQWFWNWTTPEDLVCERSVSSCVTIYGLHNLGKWGSMIQYVWYYIIYTTFYCWQDLDMLQFSQFQRFCEPYIVSQEETDLGMGLAWKLLWQFTTSTAQPQGRVCLLFLHCLRVISKSFPNPDFKSDTNRWLSRCCDFIKLKDNHKDWFLKIVPTF